MNPNTPSGIVSFLFTDLEGSTRPWEKDAEAMGASRDLHDRILREVLADRRGHGFSTAGDAFAAAFESIDLTAGAATDVQLR